MKALRVLGWIFVPFVMVLVRWRAMATGPKVIGAVWAAVVAVSWVASVAGSSSTPPAAPALASGSQQTSSSQTGATTTTSLVGTLQSYPQIGQNHAVGSDMAVTVDSITQASYIGMGSGFGAQANGMFWLVQVTVTNTSSTSDSISDSQFTIETPPYPGAQQKTYSADSGDEIYISNDNFPLLNLNPGVSATGTLVFDMPANITSTKMQDFVLNVSDGLFSGTNQNFALLGGGTAQAE